MDSKLVILSHTPNLGCEDPRCRLVYTQDEIESVEFCRFQSQHRYLESPIKLHYLELTKINPSKELYFNKFPGWTPSYILKDNGLKFEGEVDIAKLFPGQRNYHINDKKSEIENILESLNLQDQELIIFRSYRGWPAFWDCLEVWSIGRYLHDKENIRTNLFAKKAA